MDTLKIFRDAQPELEQWRQRQVRNPPEKPESGSELAEDDFLFSRHLISETIRFNLITFRVDHLRHRNPRLDLEPVAIHLRLLGRVLTEKLDHSLIARGALQVQHLPDNATRAGLPSRISRSRSGWLT